MRLLPTEFKQLLAENKHNYLVYADITLQDSTVLNLTNQHIWNGGFIVENSISEDDNFTALGSVVIGSADLIINNIDETFSEYDFTNANVVLRIGLQLTNYIHTITLGTYTVDDAQYNGATIHLYMLDYMGQFDKPYSLCRPNGGGIAITYPATLQQIAQNACLNCGVTLVTLSFDNSQYVVNTRPNDESITFREVMSWVATIAGCYVQARYDGKIELKWFNTTTLNEFTSPDLTFNPWNNDVELDGGTFNPWNTGDSTDGGLLSDSTRDYINFISDIYSQNIAVDDVVITGVSIAVKDESDSTADNIKYYRAGTTGYVIEISDNQFITTTTAQSIANSLGTKLIGLRFRKLNITHATNPAIEAGDFAIIIDRKNNIYYSIATRVTFSADGNQIFVCGATTPSRNSATRYSAQTKSYVESRRLYRQEMTEREAAIQELADSIASSSGLYTTQQAGSSGTIYYMHDKPNLADSKIVWKMTAEAWAVTTNYNGSSTQWNAGVTVNGTVIAQLLAVNGINADWLNAGNITVGGNNNPGSLKIKNSSDNDVVISDTQGVKAKNGGYFISYGDEDIFAEDNLYPYSLLNMGTIELGYKKYGPDTLVQTNNLYPYGRISLGSDVDYYGGDAESVDIGFIARSGPRVVMNLGYYSGASFTSLILMQFQSLDPVEPADLPGTLTYSPVTVQRNIGCQMSLFVAGQKHRVVDTENYGKRLHCCYETPSPYFGDIGTGKTDATGECYIFIDDIMRETICEDTQYVVFLQKEGSGDIWISEKSTDYFVVTGTPNLSFSWELKAKQRDYSSERLEEFVRDVGEDIDYASEGDALIDEYIKQSEGLVE